MTAFLKKRPKNDKMVIYGKIDQYLVNLGTECSFGIFLNLIFLFSYLIHRIIIESKKEPMMRKYAARKKRRKNGTEHGTMSIKMLAIGNNIEMEIIYEQMER
uniref:Uncharacterized protein n=1 Tax=Cacopsylla melanoneura TaxID=428564 RepID=A0A8D9E7C2_9HEMI